MKPSLPTDKQEEILRYLYVYTIEHFRQPSYREMMKYFKVNSTNAIHCRLVGLARKGYLKATGLYRGFEITKLGLDFLIS